MSNPRLSVVVPAYRAGAQAGVAVKAIRAQFDDLEGGVEIIVVDDGSDDDTRDAALGARADQVLVHAVNRGKGAAVRTGVLAAHGRTIAFTDADLAYGPDQIAGLLAAVETGADVVVGSRKHDAATDLVRARRLREIGGRVINLLTRIVLLGHYRDTQCGLKAFEANVGKQLFERVSVDGFGFDVELFVMVEQNGLVLREVPVAVRNTTRSTVHVARDATRLVLDLFRIRRRARAGRYRLPGSNG